MTDEDPRAGTSRPAPDRPEVYRADADDTVILPAVPRAADDPGPTDSSLTSVFPWRRRRTTEAAAARHAADRDGAADKSASGDRRDAEDDGSITRRTSSDDDPDGESADLLDDEEEWDDEPADLPVKAAGRRRIPRLTGALVVAILIGLGFLGGVQVQKNHDKSSAAGSGIPALPDGFDPAALFGGGGFPGGGTTGSQGQSSGGSSTSAAPIVIGQVVSVGKTSIVVRNISGKEITVALGSTKTYEKASSAPITSLKAGTNVVVSGRTSADGTATASTITTR